MTLDRCPPDHVRLPCGLTASVRIWARLTRQKEREDLEHGESTTASCSFTRSESTLAEWVERPVALDQWDTKSSVDWRSISLKLV